MEHYQLTATAFWPYTTWESRYIKFAYIHISYTSYSLWGEIFSLSYFCKGTSQCNHNNNNPLYSQYYKWATCSFIQGQSRVCVGGRKASHIKQEVREEWSMVPSHNILGNLVNPIVTTLHHLFLLHNSFPMDFEARAKAYSEFNMCLGLWAR